MRAAAHALGRTEAKREIFMPLLPLPTENSAFRMHDEASAVSFCPSFNSYSSDKLVDVAAKVSREFDGCDPDSSSGVLESRKDGVRGNGGDEEGEEEEEEFEFVSVRTDLDASTLSSLSGGLMFPLFNRELLLSLDEQDRDHGRDGDAEEDVTSSSSSIQIPLRNLFIEDRDPPSSSSSEVDELEGVAPGTYCVWTPKREVESSPSRCKKSKSTGSCSKRWRLRDLLRRSNSEGNKDHAFLFLNSSSPKSTLKKREEKVSEKQKGFQEAKPKRVEKVSAHEVFYVKTKALKEGDKKRSYLPYRRDLVGFFANVNGLGRTFPPF